MRCVQWFRVRWQRFSDGFTVAEVILFLLCCALLLAANMVLAVKSIQRLHAASVHPVSSFSNLRIDPSQSGTPAYYVFAGPVLKEAGFHMHINAVSPAAVPRLWPAHNQTTACTDCRFFPRAFQGDLPASPDTLSQEAHFWLTAQAMFVPPSVPVQSSPFFGDVSGLLFNISSNVNWSDPSVVSAGQAYTMRFTFVGADTVDLNERDPHVFLKRITPHVDMDSTLTEFCNPLRGSSGEVSILSFSAVQLPSGSVVHTVHTRADLDSQTDWALPGYPGSPDADSYLAGYGLLLRPAVMPDGTLLVPLEVQSYAFTPIDVLTYMASVFNISVAILLFLFPVVGQNKRHFRFTFGPCQRREEEEGNDTQLLEKPFSRLTN